VKYLAGLLEADKKNFIFIDETGCCLNMSRKFARSKKGTRAFSKRPSGKGKRISMIGAVKFGRMLKCMKFKGTLTGDVFYFYIKKYLLKYLDSSKTVVLDNVSPHKNKKALALIRSTGAKIIFLPPYRPELNPIEYCWSVMKNTIRKLKPRTERELMEAYDISLQTVTSKSIKSFFYHCWV
jgi:transposase